MAAALQQWARQRLNVSVSSGRPGAQVTSVSPTGAVFPWEFEREGEVEQVDPAGPLLISIGTATDLAVDAAIAGTGIEDWLRPHLDTGALKPVLKPWWQSLVRFGGIGHRGAVRK